MRFSENEIDAFTEVINIGAGRAANSLSEITGSRIELAIPSIQICGTSDFCNPPNPLTAEFSTIVQQGFEGDVSGQALLAFPADNASELARIVGGIQSTDTSMDEELCGVLEEIGNIVLNGVLGSIANLADCRLSYTIPKLSKKKAFDSIIFGDDDHAQSLQSVAVIANTSLTIAGHGISCSLILLFELGDIEELLATLATTMST